MSEGRGRKYGEDVGNWGNMIGGEGWRGYSVKGEGIINWREEWDLKWQEEDIFSNVGVEKKGWIGKEFWDVGEVKMRPLR